MRKYSHKTKMIRGYASAMFDSIKVGIVGVISYFIIGINIV